MTYKQYFFLKFTDACLSDLLSSTSTDKGWTMEMKGSKLIRLEKAKCSYEVWFSCALQIIKQVAEIFEINIDDEIDDKSAAEMMFNYIMENKK